MSIGPVLITGDQQRFGFLSICYVALHCMYVDTVVLKYLNASNLNC
jgi:hypothetical protein